VVACPACAQIPKASGGGVFGSGFLVTRLRLIAGSGQGFVVAE
jgi:hypothetical protein